MFEFALFLRYDLNSLSLKLSERVPKKNVRLFLEDFIKQPAIGKESATPSQKNPLCIYSHNTEFNCHDFVSFLWDYTFFYWPFL